MYNIINFMSHIIKFQYLKFSFKMKYKFIIIYSDGPMGSTSLGSLIEKYGFINLPFRKFLLSEYVMGIRKLTDKSMQYRCIETINTLSEKLCLGGTSGKDRDSRKAKLNFKTK